MKLANYSFEQLEVGQEFRFSHTLSEKEVDLFSDLTQDKNPLHCDSIYAKKTSFGNRLVHGMLAGSLFSTLVGMYCPGKPCLYLSQTLKFQKPILVGTKVDVVGKILRKVDAGKLLIIATLIQKDNQIFITGEAMVKVREDV